MRGVAVVVAGLIVLACTPSAHAHDGWRVGAGSRWTAKHLHNGTGFFTDSQQRLFVIISSPASHRVRCFAHGEHVHLTERNQTIYEAAPYDVTHEHWQTPLLLGMRWEGPPSSLNHATPFIAVAGVIGDREWRVIRVNLDTRTLETAAVHDFMFGSDINAGLMFELSESCSAELSVGYRWTPESRTDDQTFRRAGTSYASGRLHGESSEYFATAFMWHL